MQLFALWVVFSSFCLGQVPSGDTLPGTAPLQWSSPLDGEMVRGINRFAEEELALARERRKPDWLGEAADFLEGSAPMKAARGRLSALLGVVDQRLGRGQALFVDDLNIRGPEFPGTYLERLPVFEGVDAELLAVDLTNVHVLIVPDADWAPEHLTGGIPGLAVEEQVVRRLAERGISSRTLRLINRDPEFSGRPDIRMTNQSHREYLYRPAFELGRHIMGYEIQKILRAVDEIEPGRPVVVWGIGEGARLALCAAAIDPRIQLCIASGEFREREPVWTEPIERNVWKLLVEFGDAEIASLIAPRGLLIEACRIPEVAAPPAPTADRHGGAPGRIVQPSRESVAREYERARSYFERLGAGARIQFVESGPSGTGPCGAPQTMAAIAALLPQRAAAEEVKFETLSPRDSARRLRDRQQDQIEQLRRHTQRLLHQAARERDKLWSTADRSTVAAWEKSCEAFRTKVYDELIGRIPAPLLPPNPRSRKVIDAPTHVGYEVVLDVFRSEAAGSQPVIAGGILLVPKDLKPGEQRPCVVCQHGLEGTPMDTIDTNPKHSAYAAYKGFSTQLVERGFIVYAPQNPYRGRDEFRVIQRKSNPLGRSLFSYIIPQHQQTLNWLATLPYVDASRIGFYGLSYGGKTAMRVPPLLPPRTEPDGSRPPGYCLSICSADFNEWILKNASTEDRYSYVFTGEYEIFEWNMGHLANYAELASLMAPRPFMVERGHDDGVAPDEWVAWEFAKVQRHYDKLGIGDRARMEVFDGPHTINGRGTFDFLHRHLNWPAPAAR